MRCSDYSILISRYIDGVLEDRERHQMLEHIHTCPHCAATLAQYRSMDVVLRRAPSREPPEGGPEQVFDKLGQSHSLDLRHLASRLGLGLCLVALVSLALVLGSYTASSSIPSNKVAVQPNPTSISIEASVDDIGPKFANPANKYINDARGVPPPASGNLPTVLLPNGPSLPGVRTEFASLAVGDGRPKPDHKYGLVGALPPGASLQRITLERTPASPHSYRLEVLFWLANGVQYRLQEVRSDPPWHPTPRLADYGALSAGGLVWRYGKTGSPFSPGEYIWMMFAVSGNRTVQLEGAPTLEDLLEQLDWLR